MVELEVIIVKQMFEKYDRTKIFELLYYMLINKVTRQFENEDAFAWGWA